MLVTRASRELDLTTHLVKQTVGLTVENTGESPLTSLLYTVDSGLADKLAFIGAQVGGIFLGMLTEAVIRMFFLTDKGVG